MSSSALQTIETRMREAETLWREGDALRAEGNDQAAYQRYTQAHDLIIDCPSLHERAHRKLALVSAQQGHRGEIIIDTLLVRLAPLGVFKAIAMAQGSMVATLAACRRTAATPSLKN